MPRRSGRLAGVEPVNTDAAEARAKRGAKRRARSKSPAPAPRDRSRTPKRSASPSPAGKKSSRKAAKSPSPSPARDSKKSSRKVSKKGGKEEGEEKDVGVFPAADRAKLGSQKWQVRAKLPVDMYYAGVRRRMPLAKLPEVMGAALGGLPALLGEKAIPMAGSALGACHFFGDGEIEMSMAFRTTGEAHAAFNEGAKKKSTRRGKGKVLGPPTADELFINTVGPADGKIAYGVLRGPYEQLGEAWGSLLKWVGDQGLTQAMDKGNFEVYSKGEKCTKDSKEYETELFVFVK